MNGHDPGPTTGVTSPIPDELRLDLTADLDRPDQLTSLVVANTDPVGGRADAQFFVEQSLQGDCKSLFGHRAGLEGSFAGAGRGADTGSPPRRLGGPALSLPDRPFDVPADLASLLRQSFVTTPTSTPSFDLQSKRAARSE